MPVCSSANADIGRLGQSRSAATGNSRPFPFQAGAEVELRNFWHLFSYRRMLDYAMKAQQLRIYAIADIHSPDSFHMAQLSPESYDLVRHAGRHR